MIRQTEEPTSEALPERALGGYRLDASPKRREGGSLLFSATAPDGSPVALQVSAEPVQNRRARARFRRVARTRAGLEHPSLLRVREVGGEGGRLFVATEPFPARSLADLLREGPLEPDLALRLLRPVANGLDAAHAAGLAHRTLSAESVLLDGESVKLDLFGLFTVAGQPSFGDVVRKDAHLHYESPEGVRGDELSPASNVYALTGLLVHALTGRQPFAHHDPVMITYAHLSQPAPKPSELNPELPAALDAIVARGMSKEPGERPESAGALIAGAAMVLRSASHPAPAPAPPAPASEAPAPVSEAPAPAPVKPTAPATPRAPATPPARATPPPPANGGSPPPWVVAAAAAPATPAPAPRATPEADARHVEPLKARLARFAPLLLVILVGAAFGVLLGMPGSSPEQAASPVRSADERAVQRLDNVRFRLRDDLAFASTADEQADVARRLAMAYGHAADQLSSPELVSGTQRAATAYASLEQAARAADEARYASARGRVEAAESAIAAALTRIDRQRTRG